MSSSSYFDSYHPSPKLFSSDVINQSIEAFLASGGVIQEVAAGVLSVHATMSNRPVVVNKTTHRPAHEHRPNAAKVAEMQKPKPPASPKPKKEPKPSAPRKASDKPRKPNRVGVRNLASVKEGLELGLNNYGISEKYGLHYSTIFKIRQKHGLLGDSPRKIRKT